MRWRALAHSAPFRPKKGDGGRRRLQCADACNPPRIRTAPRKLLRTVAKVERTRTHVE